MKLCDFCKTSKKPFYYELILRSGDLKEDYPKSILHIESEACPKCTEIFAKEIANLINKMKAKIEVTTIKKVEKFERND